MEIDEVHSPLIRVMALHALAYCERLFYLEEVEEIRIADEAVYAGRRLHEELQDDSDERFTLELQDEELGLKGKVDCLRYRDGRLIPYEHKRGKPHTSAGVHQAWPADSLQVSSYAMLVEKHTGKGITEGRIRYHTGNITISVPVDDHARERVQKAVMRARELRESVNRPPIAVNDRLCLHCSLAPVCLPEEERLLSSPEWEPIRLFPQDYDTQTVYVTEHGARIGRAGDTLVVTKTDGEKIAFPVKEVGNVVLLGNAQITTQAVHLCAYNEIGVHWVTTGGRYLTSISSGSSLVQRKIRQYEALRDPGLAFRLARRLAKARIESQLRFILRASRGKNRDETGVNSYIAHIRIALRGLQSAEGIDTVRGFEGIAGKEYFEVLPRMLVDGLDSRLYFCGRNRRPPQDCFNALLSFGYSLLYRDVMTAIVTVGLESAFGFFHKPRSAAHPLALDLMELFRVPLWDMALIASVNRKQWDAEKDFSFAGRQVWLNEGGRKKAIEIYENRKDQKWKHPVTRYSLTYARLIELEVRLLEKEWTGQPGLFACMRLR